MVKKRMRVLCIGDGVKAKKAVELALRHPRIHFTAVDKNAKDTHRRYLRNLGQKDEPPNLTVKPRTDAVEFLKSKKPGYYGHIYGHFVLSVMRYPERDRLYRQMKRVLESGARFVAVDHASFLRQLRLELGKHGFEVSTRRVTPKELLRLGTDWAEEHASTVIGLRERLESTRYISWLYKLNVRRCSEHFRDGARDQYSRLEGDGATKEAMEAAERIVKDSPKDFSKKPFVVITAKKPRNR